MAEPAAPPETPRVQYPQHVRTAEQRRRWDLVEAIVERDFADEPEDFRWMTKRALYNDPLLPTD